MATETPKIIETESLITPSETPVPAQPAQSITATSARKTQGKRGRPKKAETSLTRTTRRIARSKGIPKPKIAPPAPKMTMLNRLVNFSVVAAVFVTALAIQRIVPTGPVTAPKVEALPAQTAEAPVIPGPETDPTAATVPVATPAAAPSTAPEAPKVATTDCNPPAASAPKPAAAAQQVTRRPRMAASRVTQTQRDHNTPLNSGGTEDLDSEAARQAYMAKSKLATRVAAPTK